MVTTWAPARGLARVGGQRGSWRLPGSALEDLGVRARSPRGRRAAARSRGVPAALIQLLAMLLPSPIQATVLPSQPPRLSRTVMRSASTWQGCSRSVSPLITGIERVPRQLLDVGVVEGADHDAVEVAGEHPRGVADRLAAAELDVARREEERVPAELVARPPRTRPGCGWSSWRRSSRASCRPAACSR